MRLTMLAVLCGLATPLVAQTPADSALAVVVRLFEAMHAKDSLAIAATFDTSAALLGYTRQGDQERVTRTPVAEFARSIARLPAGTDIEESIWDPAVLVDGNLAVVWTPYAFLINGAISHCGYDAVMLMRFATGSQIVVIADTRRRDGCELPAR
ncbi:MAG: hypothetical protein WD934_02640 [Gemmatimonadales bacterium]